ncbi:hypothetical protein [Pontibacterium sp.]|uniref:beta-sandwich lipoprotein n=1 Tax=Pontibacterium sp. TaxID=2036026 RepID=UPI00356A4039
MKYAKQVLGAASILIALLVSGCVLDDATVAKHNLTKAADNFELNRRIIFINTWTDTQLQIIEGRCNIEYDNSRTSVICKVSDSEYKRSLIGNSGQVTAMVEQLEGVPVNVYHYRRTFKPQTIIPDIDFRGSAKAAVNAVTPDKQD